MHGTAANSNLAAGGATFSDQTGGESIAIKIENVPVQVAREFRAQCARMGIRQAEGFTQAVAGWLGACGTLVQ